MISFKVNFKLHDSYANNNRIVTKPPYEVSAQAQANLLLLEPQKVVSAQKNQVTETGWGEFEIQIKIYLADPVERPVTIYHVLKLFQVSKNTPSPNLDL